MLATRKAVDISKNGRDVEMSEIDTKQHPIRADVQGLRALAVVAVVIFHAGLALPGGFVGVDIFFVISGFVITASLLREHLRNGRISLRGFYWRRFRRLVPGLSLVVSATLLLSWLVLSPFGPQQTAATTGLAAIFSLANVAIARTTGGYFDSAAGLNPLLHTWTLSVEEQFYFVFPIALVISIALVKNLRRAAVGVLALGTTVSLGLAMASPWLLAIYDSQFLGFYSPITRAWEFGVGALLASWVVLRPPKLSATTARVPYIAGFALIGASLTSLSQQFPFPGPITLLPVVGTTLVIFAGSARPWGDRDPLAARFPVLIGDWSYSIYLWHWPFISLAKMIWPDRIEASVLAASVSLIPALLSYYFLEQSFRRKQTKSPKETSLFVLPILGLPVVLAVALWGYSNNLESQMGNATELPAGYQLGCHRPGQVEAELEICRFGPAESADSTPIYLVGDSHAAHFTSGLVDASTALNQPLAVITASACPLLDGVYPPHTEDENFAERCPAWQKKVFDFLTDAPPGVVIWASSDGYWSPERLMLSTAGDERLFPESLALFEQGLQGLLSTLSDSGHKVILVQTVPRWTGVHEWSLDRCGPGGSRSACDREMPLYHAENRSEETRQIVSLQGEAFSAKVIDFSDQLCPNRICMNQRGGVWIYRDVSHLTNASSAGLASQWTRVLNALNTELP